MNNIENIKFFLGDLKASNYNLSFIESVENLIKENKELKEILEKISKDLDNIAYDQIPIEMQRAFGKEYDLGYRQGWYNAEEDWKLKVKEKIEELRKKQIKNTTEKLFYDYDINRVIIMLKELLEGE